MPISLRPAPSVTGGAFQGYFEGLRSGQRLSAEREAAERADLALALQIQSAQRQGQTADLQRRVGEVNLAAALARQADEAQGRKLATGYLGQPGQTVELAPERPAQGFAVPDTAAGEDAAALAGMLPATVPAPTPTRPAVTTSAPTMQTLQDAASQTGVDLGAVLGTPAMQQALKTRPVVSQQEFEAQQRRGKAKEEFARINDEARQTLETGEDESLTKAMGLRLRAMRAAMEAIDDPAQQVRAATQLQEAERLYFAARREPVEAAKASRELAPFMAAVRAYGANPDHDTASAVLSAAVGVSHKLALPVVKQGLDTFEKIVAADGKRGSVHRDVAALDAATVQMLGQLYAEGATVSPDTWIKARQAAAKANPAGVVRLVNLARHDPKAQGLSDLDMRAFFGVPKGSDDKDWVEASANVLARNPNLSPAEPQFQLAVSDEKTRLVQARKPEKRERDMTSYELRSLRSQMVTQDSALGREQNAIKNRPGGTFPAPEDTERLRQIAAERTDLQNRIKEIDGLLGTKHGLAAPASPAPKKTPEQVVTRAREIAAEVRGQNPGILPDALKQAVRERLIQEGFDQLGAR